MVVFALRTDHCGAVEKWLRETKTRSKSENFLQNPFKMRFRRYRSENGLILVFDVRPLFPNVTFFGWIIAVAVLFIFGRVNWVVWGGVILGMLGYFWTADFFYQMSKIAIKKAGYKGSKIKRIRLSSLVEEVMF